MSARGGVCNAMRRPSILDGLKSDPAYDGVSFFRVDYDKQKDVVSKLDCPRATLIAYKDGKEVARMSWDTSQDAVLEAFSRRRCEPAPDLAARLCGGDADDPQPLRAAAGADRGCERPRAKDPRGPIALGLGLAATFGVVGGVLASFGVEFGDSDWRATASAVIMIAIGAALAGAGGSATRSNAGSVLPAARPTSLGERLPNAGLAGQAAAGVVLAFAWAPCAGPILGAALHARRQRRFACRRRSRR